jgi:hypothetical protein
MNKSYHEQKYGCNNCLRQNNPCRDNKRDCRLNICMAEHISEPGKIEKFVDVLTALKMTVISNSRGFQIVSV